MARKSEGIWFWQARQAWYCTVNGKQVKLGQDEEKATKKWHEIMALADSANAGDSNSVAVLAEQFLDWIQRNKKPKTYRVYRYHLQAFCSVHGNVKVKDLKPLHVENVLKAHANWSASTERGAKVALRTAINWSVKQGYCSSNPLAGRLDLPPIASRGRSAEMTDEDYNLILEYVNEELRDFLVVVRHTGTRPHVIANLTEEDVDFANACLVVKEHKTDSDGQPLVVHLDKVAEAVIRKWLGRYPSGAIFRNSRGNQWNDNAWGQAIIDARKRIVSDGKKLTSKGIAYGLRHAFATEQLALGVPEAEVAALLGHKSTDMLHKHYSHLTTRTKRLKRHMGNIKTTAKEAAILAANDESQEQQAG